jgi:predicted enzyme related to lactoylglutathione lyase
MPKLYRVILPVSDIDQAATFYGKVLNAPGQRISPGRHYFDCGGTILACYDPVADGDPLNGDSHPHPNQYLYFAVADIESTFSRAKAAGCRELDEKIERMPWGERLFYAKDPFGNPICFVDEKTLFTGS